VDFKQLHIVKKTYDSSLKDLFAKAGKINTFKLQVHKEEVLRKAVDSKFALEAFVKLVIVRNLPYNCSQWLELHAFVIAINYTA
jgi:16S rRNA A1518/A1519 N6-dimethyltransferase RsmA/KsgA/DIM1 with predicted DNA glycosylase/AP lyase activity